MRLLDKLTEQHLFGVQFIELIRAAKVPQVIVVVDVHCDQQGTP